MLAFDAPAREECTAERPRSNTPLAALVLLNDPSYVEAARVFSERALERSPGAEPTKVISWMVSGALGRQAGSAELEILLALFESELSEFAADTQAAKELIAIGLSKANPALAAEDLAAWTMVARSILNLHETVTRN